MEKAFIILNMFIVLLLPGKLLAQISANPSSGCAPLSGVQFTGPVGAANITWDFGNSTSSNLPNPTATFTTPGLYNVTYTATLNGNTVNYTTQVNVYASPTAAFRATTDTVGCARFPVTFQDLSTSPGGATITQWEWAFGDGSFSNTGPTVTHPYTLPGRFSVTLKVTDSNGCVATSTRPNQVTVSAPPRVILNHPTQLTSCQPPFTVSFTSTATSFSPNGGALTYNWNFGNGVTSTVNSPPSVTYTANGTYTVRLTVTDNMGCDTTLTRTVVVDRPVASFYAAGAVNDSVCPFVTFVNETPGVSVSWRYGDGVSSSADTHTYQIPGTYQVTMYAYAGTCTDDTTITINVTKPIPDFELLPIDGCETSAIIELYNQSTPGVASWSIGSPLFPRQNHTGDTVRIPYSLPDTTDYVIFEPIRFDVTLVVTNNVGCTDTLREGFFPWWPITARFMVDTFQSCFPLTVTFHDSSFSSSTIVRYDWYFGDGSTYFGVDSIVTHTYAQPGTYDAWLVVENQQGCIDTSIFRTIIVREPPSPNFSINNTVLCVGDTLTLTDLTPPGDSVDTWAYYINGIPLQNHCPNDPNATWVAILPPGTYSVTLDAGRNDCAQSTTQTNAIQVKGPYGHFEIETDCATPYVIATTAVTTNVDSLVWDFGDGTIINTASNWNPTHTYAQTGNYTVVLTLFNRTDGCPPITYEQLVKIRDLGITLPDFKVCQNDTFSYTAQLPEDVYARCSRGYLWDFEPTAPLFNTAQPYMGYMFPTTGTRTIHLYVRDENDCWDTVSSQVRVYGIDAAIGSNAITGCMPLTIDFTDNTVSDTFVTSWTWDFGDSTSATTENPSHTYTVNPVGNSYNVHLVVRNALGCMDSTDALITPSLPNVGFNIIGQRFLCLGDSIKFSAVATNHDSYVWDFGDNSGPGPDSSTVVHYYNSIGTFDVSLNVVDTLGCPNSVTITQLVIVQGTVDAGFTSTGDSLTTLCYPIQLNFTDTTQGGFSRIWDLGTGSPVQPIPTVGTLWDEPGTYTVSLIVKTSFGCPDTMIRTFNVEGPEGDFNLSANAICKGEEITFNIFDTTDVEYFTWNFGDGYDTTQVSPISHTYNFHPPSGQTVVSLTMWSTDSACAASVQKPIIIHRVIADFERNGDTTYADTAHCIGTVDVFNNSSIGADQWNWDFGNGTNFSGENPPQVLFDSAGIFVVELAVRDLTLGCVDTIRKTLEVFPRPEISATGGVMCEGDVFQLNSSIASVYPVGYTWLPAEALNDPTLADPLATPPTTTDYTVIATDTNTCADTAFATVIVIPRPPAVDWDTQIVIGQEVDLNVDLGSGYTYTWTPSEGLSCTSCPILQAQPLEDTDYTVIISDSSGCFDIPSYYRFVVKPLTTIDVPTAFTPNADGSNDLIFVRGWGIQSLVEFKIYNRWGQLVFETSDINQGWDGTFNGKPQNNDSYTYHAVVETWVKTNDGYKILEKTGSFSLVR